MMKIEEDVLNTISSENGRKFCERTYSTDESVYINRINALDFAGNTRVLDAGCGYGQWSFPLAKLNNQVTALDISDERIATCQKIQASYFPSIKNLNFSVGSIDDLPFENESFDAVFSYSAIYYTDFKKTLSEFYRILKANGKLYFSTNDLGWYIYNILENPNEASDFSPRQYGIDTIENSLKYFSTGVKDEGSVVMPLRYTINFLEQMGFKLVGYGGDGEININNTETVPGFFKKQYLNKTSVYEVLVKK